MILGQFLPLLLLAIGVIDALIFRHLAGRGMISEGKANALLLVSLMLPLIAYVVLNFVLIDLGATLVF